MALSRAAYDIFERKIMRNIDISHNRCAYETVADTLKLDDTGIYSDYPNRELEAHK